MPKYISPYVKCPFYKCENSQSIHCEGISEENTIHMIFYPARAKNSYRKRVCEKDYTKCPIAGMLNQKYGVEK